EVTRSLCLTYHPVRRRIYEVRFPERVAPTDALLTDATVDIDVEIDPTRNLFVAGVEAYLDGKPWPLESSAIARLAPGVHHVNVELYLGSPETREGPIRIDASSTLMLPRPLAGASQVNASVLVQVTDSRQGKLIDRITQVSTVDNFRAPPPPSPSPPSVANEPTLLPPTIGVGRRLSNVNLPEHKPSLPPMLNRRGATFWGLYKVCVSDQGTVTKVRTMKSAFNAALDLNWKTTIRTWRYQPYTVGGRPVPFCSPVRLQVTSG
ncbi:MAG TPA: hypothetical protein VGF45_14055, partial [Polyangia bacterium]